MLTRLTLRMESSTRNSIIVMILLFSTFSFLVAYETYGYTDAETGSLIYKDKDGTITGVEDEVLQMSRYPTQEELQTGEYSQPLAYCLSKKAVLYYTDTCPYCNEQRRLFGDTEHLLSKVNCGEESCEEINRVPTWKIDGEYISGLKSLEDLKKLSGC